MNIEVRDVHNTNLAEMTLYIEQHQECLSEKTWDWIKAEVLRLPFDDYIKSTVMGCCLRSCLIASKFVGWLGDKKNNQMLILKNSNLKPEAKK